MRIRLLGVVVAVFVVCLAHGAAHAQRKSVADLAKELEALATQVQALAAQSGTNTQAVQELSEKVTNLEQAIGVLRREQSSIPDAVNRLDDLDIKVASLRSDLEAMRTQVANIEQPSAGPSGGGGTPAGHVRGGFSFETEDGAYSLTLGGFMHPQYALTTPSELDSITTSDFTIRRARVRLTGHTSHPDLRYRLLFELTGGNPLLDFWGEYEIKPEISIRVGQDKLYHSRNFTAGTTLITFPERAAAIGNLRYDRDIGVWARGTLLDDKLFYTAGISNGGGRNNLNDNIDFVTMARVDGAILGTWMKPGFGDVEHSEDPRLQVGGAVLHDLVRVPEELGGIEVGNRDVDDDLVVDNVRVISSEIDATLRYQGFELYLEWLYRHERWGTILDHTDNQDIADEIEPDSEGHRNYQAVSGHATYFAVPEKLMFGFRVSYSRIPLLGVTGRDPTSARDRLPLSDRLLETDVLVQLYADSGYRFLGFQYTLSNFNQSDGPEPAGDIEHRFLLGLQLTL